MRPMNRGIEDSARFVAQQEAAEVAAVWKSASGELYRNLRSGNDRRAYDFKSGQPMTQKQFETEMDAITPASVESMLTERGSRYGRFIDHAEITQKLKMAAASFLRAKGKALALDQQEALDMIFHKIARILNGDPDYADNWIDIAGYATLVAKRLDGESL